MEIFQTIWNALISENEIVLNLTAVPMLFIEMTLTLLLFTTILNISYSKKNAIVFIVSNVVLALFTQRFIPQPYNVFTNIFVFTFLVYFILKTNALKAILAEVTVYTISFVVVTPLITLYSYFFKIDSITVSYIPIHKMFYSLIFYVIMFIIYKILKRLNWHITFFDKFDNFTYNTLIINFILGSFAIALQAYIESYYIDYLPKPLVYTSMAILVVYFAISLFSLFRTSKLEETQQSLKTQKQYNENLSTLHDNIRGFKHDFNNIVQTFGGYLSTNNIDGLRVYYKDLLEECQINNNLSFLNPEIINNPVIYSLLCDKYAKATEQSIKLNLEVLADLSSLDINMYELSRILGVLFDNAIEAAAKCNNKIVNIIFRKDKTRNKDLIIIQNTYTNKNVNIDKIFEKGYSSKQDNHKDKSHGLGLWEVRKYLKKNPHLDLYTTKTDKFFSQQFEIYN